MTTDDTTRRPRGEGSIYERKDGRWVASMRDPVTGKRRSGYASSEAGAYAKLRKMTGRQKLCDVHSDCRYAWLPNTSERPATPVTSAKPRGEGSHSNERIEEAR